MPKTIDMAKCPETFRGGIERYLRAKINPGHFLSAVLKNDLMEAFNRGDETSLRELRGLMVFLYNDVPYKAWGSDERVRSFKGIANDPKLTEELEVINGN